MKVRDIMRDVYVIDKDISYKDAAKIMSEKRIGSFIVVEKRVIKGIITDGDILRHFSKKGTISKVMSRNVVVVGPDEDINVALELMKEKKVKHLPVVNEKNEVIGILTSTDIAAHAEELDGDFFFD